MKWLIAAIVVVGLALAGASWLAFGPNRAKVAIVTPPAAVEVSKATDPKERPKAVKAALKLSAEEEVARKYILDTANDPASVEFVAWGPHLENARLLLAIESMRLIRVKYRAKNAAGAKEFFDDYVLMRDGKAVAKDKSVSVDNSVDAQKHLRELLAESAKAIEDSTKKPPGGPDDD